MRLRAGVIAALIASLAATSLTGCAGSDFSRGPLAVDAWDHGWLLAIEPEEAFEIRLAGTSAAPGACWRAVQFDDQILQLQDWAHEWPSETPHPDDPGTPLVAFTTTYFTFAGVAEGTSTLRFELVAGDQVINAAEYTVKVVDDACDAETAATANRCHSQDGFTFQPQTLNPMDGGQQVQLSTGATASLLLVANALHPDVPWRVVEHDDAVISIGEPASVTPREPGDFSAVDPYTFHGFIPAWEYTIAAVAPGTSTVVLELAVDGTAMDSFTLTFEVSDA